MTGRSSRIQKYMLCFQKICNFWENCDFIEKKIVKKLIFFLANLKFLMAPLDTQQHLMPMKYNFFLYIFVRSKVSYVHFFCEKSAKVEHTICDCN